METSLKISQRRVVRSRDPAEEDAGSLTRVPEQLGEKRRRGETLEEFSFWGVVWI